MAKLVLLFVVSPKVAEPIDDIGEYLLYCTEEHINKIINDISTYLGFVALWFQVKPVLEFVEGKPAR